jgi:AcrR family transcriptional regulator
LFARQGYDAASMDQVAAKAGVNKALIYYYFKSKDGLRKALYAHIQQDLIDFMDRFMAGITPEQLRMISAQGIEAAMEGSIMEYMERFVRNMIDFLEEHRNALKLMLMESIKTSSDYPAIFGIFETLFRDQLAKMKAKGILYTAGAQELIYEFYTGFMPMLTFIVFHDQWARHFRISEEKAKKDFLESFIKSHVINANYRLMEKRGKNR